MPDISTTFRVDGADQFTRAVRDMETQARRFGSTVQSTFVPARQAVSSFSSALSSLATITRLTGAQNDDLARKMESLSLAVASVTLAVTALRGVTTGLVAALAALRLATVGALAVFAPMVAVIAVAAFALAHFTTLLIDVATAHKRAEEAAKRQREALDQLNRSTAATSAAIQLENDIIAMFAQGMAAGTETGKRHREEQEKLAEAAGDQRFRQRVEMIEREAAAEEAVANTILSTTAQLARQIEIKQQSIAAFERLIRTGGLTSDQLQDLQAKVALLSNELVGLKHKLDTAADSWQLLARALGGVQRLVEQGVAAGIELAKVLRKEREETAFANQLAQERAARLRETAAQIAAYRDALNDASRAQEDWNRQNAFDARQQGEVEEGFRRRETALQRSVALMDNAVAQRRAEVAGLQELTVAIQAEVAALEREIAAKIAAGIPTAELVKSTQRLRDALGEIQHRSALAARALDQALGEPARELARGLADAFQRSFEDTLQNARDVGDAIVGFFRSVVNSLISMFARLAAQRLFDWLLPLLSPAFPTPGFNVPVRSPVVAAQMGMVVNRPTMALLGEGGERELVLPERFWPALRQSGRSEGRGRPVQVTIHSYVVFDPAQVKDHGADPVSVLVADIRAGGPSARAIRAIAR